MIPKTYYYIDYKEFVDVVKWKMYKMQTIVRDNLRTESENKGYICHTCEKQFTPLDVLSLVNMTDQLFHCDMCESVLEENDNAENVKGSQQVLTRLREQSQPIITLLKQTDAIVIPSSYIYKHTQGSKKNGANSDEYELAIAQDTGLGQGDIIVDLQMDNEAARRAKMEEAEQKRQQNALPVWHQRSTISDTVLVPTERSADAEEGEEEEVFEDAGHLGLDQETEDYYAKYYESLSNNTPMETGGEGGGGGGGEGFEEESFDEYSRKRSHEDMEETFEEQASGSGEEEFDEEGEIPMVSVNGKMIPLNEIQEEDQRNMTTEEYKAYYEAWESWENA
ncbi:hypothetical protein K501DRAFT_189305 [Backusella circina FSU 941]|nr:hypothetical protein K501DRAFT_189305 [Backusella circina FSU 941]